MGSDARQGIAAFVPSRSLTWTMIMGSPVGAGAAFFSFFSFFGFSVDCGSVFASAGFSRSGDRGRGLSRSRYPLSNLFSSSPPRLSSSLRFSFHLNPPVRGLGRSSSRRPRGDRERLFSCSSRRGGGDVDLDCESGMLLFESRDWAVTHHHFSRRQR